ASPAKQFEDKTPDVSTSGATPSILVGPASARRSGAAAPMAGRTAMIERHGTGPTGGTAAAAGSPADPLDGSVMPVPTEVVGADGFTKVEGVGVEIDVDPG